MRFISILRGINVSGQKKIKMSDLIALYKSLGFRNIETYIQSGNVAFDIDADIDFGDGSDLVNRIEKGIKKQYDFDVPVIIRSKAELQKTIKASPFVKRSDLDFSKLHVTFLESGPNEDALKAFDPPSSARDEIVIKGREVYLYCPDGYGRTKLTNTYLEKKLAVRATTRNWKTVSKLLEMVS